MDGPFRVPYKLFIVISDIVAILITRERNHAGISSSIGGANRRSRIIYENSRLPRHVFRSKNEKTSCRDRDNETCDN